LPWQQSQNRSLEKHNQVVSAKFKRFTRASKKEGG